MSTQHIALYGRGGVGTSTTAANISAALAEAGHRVVQVGSIRGMIPRRSCAASRR